MKLKILISLSAYIFEAVNLCLLRDTSMLHQFTLIAYLLLYDENKKIIVQSILYPIVIQISRHIMVCQQNTAIKQNRRRNAMNVNCEKYCYKPIK